MRQQFYDTIIDRDGCCTVRLLCSFLPIISQLHRFISRNRHVLIDLYTRHHVNGIPQTTSLPELELFTFRRFPFSSRWVVSVMSFQHAMCRYCCSLVYIHEWRKDIAVASKWTLYIIITVKKFEIYAKAFMSHTVTLDCFHKLAGLLVMVDSINKLADSKFLNGQLSMTFLQAQ